MYQMSSNEMPKVLRSMRKWQVVNSSDVWADEKINCSSDFLCLNKMFMGIDNLIKGLMRSDLIINLDRCLWN